MEARAQESRVHQGERADAPGEQNRPRGGEGHETPRALAHARVDAACVERGETGAGDDAGEREEPARGGSRGGDATRARVRRALGVFWALRAETKKREGGATTRASSRLRLARLRHAHLPAPSMRHAGASPSLKLSSTSCTLQNLTTEEYLPMMGLRMAQMGLNAHGESTAATCSSRLG